MQQLIALNTNQSEQLSAIKANDEKALQQLYQQNFPKVEMYILQNNGSTEQAKDIFQEAFIAVWRNIQLNKFNPESETAIAGYIYQIAKYKWLDHLRSSYYKKVLPIDEKSNEMVVEVLPEEENNYIVAVRKNIQLLGENCREIMKQFYYQKQSLKLIAEKFNWTEATARNNKYRCVQRLRELMKNS